jgi:hypothetical protein
MKKIAFWKDMMQWQMTVVIGSIYVYLEFFTNVLRVSIGITNSSDQRYHHRLFPCSRSRNGKHLSALAGIGITQEKPMNGKLTGEYA